MSKLSFVKVNQFQIAFLAVLNTRRVAWKMPKPICESQLDIEQMVNGRALTEKQLLKPGTKNATSQQKQVELLGGKGRTTLPATESRHTGSSIRSGVQNSKQKFSSKDLQTGYRLTSNFLLTIRLYAKYCTTK